VDGSVSQYRYTGVALKFDDAGEKGGSKLIKQKVGFKATRRQEGRLMTTVPCTTARRSRSGRCSEDSRPRGCRQAHAQRGAGEGA
jgi:hypothetical protein